ncbi:major facilitator superfamily transporter [Phaeosphaeria sp. MPI-PUGE-AT-0046c]|nr:major facilitator superfamily transporter [Phaeosphaeria sp. MPI-PUGE-AT-0046c]
MAEKETPAAHNENPLENIEEDEYPSSLRLAAIVTSLVLSIFLASLDTTIITTAIPSITNDFHSLADYVWGKAYKYFPVKPVFLSSIAIFELGSLLCALAPNSDAFIAGRAITGTGCAGTFSGCFIIIALSSLSATFAVASVVGPLIGGAFTQDATWRWCFYINLPCGGVAAAAMLFAFRAPKAASPTPATTKEKFLQMDILGAILICATIICFTLALRWAGVEKSWQDSKVIGTLLGAAIFLMLFGIDQWYQGERALVMPNFLRNRVLLVGAVFEFLIAGCFSLPLFYLPIYFQAVRGVSAISSGVRLIPIILGLTITQIVVGGVITVTGVHNPFLITGPVIATVGTGLLMLLDENSKAGYGIGFQIVLGVGVGFCLTIPLMLSQVVVKTKDVSTATSIIIWTNEFIKSLRTLAPAVDPLVVVSAGANKEAISSLPDQSLTGIVQSYSRALHFTFAIGIPFAGLALLVSLFMPWFKYTDASQKAAAKTEENHLEKGSAVEENESEKKKKVGI